MSSEIVHDNRAAELLQLVNLGTRVIAYITHSVQFLNLSANGMLRAPQMVAVMSASNTLFEKILEHGELSDSVRELIEQVCEAADVLIARHRRDELPQEELEAGLPLIFATNLIGIWGALESFVGDVFKITLRFNRQLLAEDGFKNVNLPVSLLADPEGDALYDAIYQKALPPGTGAFERFEDLFKRVNLRNIGVEDELKRKLRAAHQIRNVWAHNSGIADRHFVENCPYLPYKLGQRVDMSQETMQELSQAVIDYIALIMKRVNKKFADDGLIPPTGA
ncbi:hypothetical protein [Nocardia farcinica]